MQENRVEAGLGGFVSNWVLLCKIVPRPRRQRYPAPERQRVEIGFKLGKVLPDLHELGFDLNEPRVYAFFELFQCLMEGFFFGFLLFLPLVCELFASPSVPRLADG